MTLVSDFRSDTVTKPSPAMLAAMFAAEVGDDVLDGDPTVGRLEAEVARLLGKEGALFVPSGTMANQVAVGAWTRAGEELVTERGAHIVYWEAGALGSLHGVQAQTLDAPTGELDPREVGALIGEADIHRPRTAVVSLEQTFMGLGLGTGPAASGGRVVPLENLESVAAVAREARVPVHLDGARLFNAAVASGIAADRWAGCADSVAICLSKGLGAPVGSVVAGDAAFLERARHVRKRLGGWMRQAGYLAAAGLFALEHNVERLSEDHALARQLAERVDAWEGLGCDPREVQTNIVMVRVERGDHDPRSLSAALAGEGIGALPISAEALRFVTHLDVGSADVERVATALERILG